MLERLSIDSHRKALDIALLAAVILLVAITPLGREATHPIVLFVSRTLLLAIITTYALFTDRTKLRTLCPYFTGAVAVLGFLMLVSVLREGGSRFEGFHSFYTHALFAGAFIALAHTSQHRPAWWKVLLLTAVVVIGIVYFVIAKSTANPVVIGPFINPNYLASFFLPGLGICVAVALSKSSGAVKVAATAGGLLLFYGIGQTASRGAMVAALAMLAVAGFRAAQSHGMSWVRVSAVALVVLFAAAALNPALVRKFLDRGSRDPYNYVRAQVWMGTASMIAQYPISGVGLARYYYNAKQFTPAVEGLVARRSRWPNIAHSEYLQHTAEIGIPGALLLFGIPGYLLLLAWRRTPARTDVVASVSQEAAILAAAGIGVHALVDNNWTVPVLAAGLAVISQADLLPYSDSMRSPLRWPALRTAMAVILGIVWLDAAFMTSAGLYYNERGAASFKTENFAQAETFHRYALALLPGHPVLLDNLGMVYFDNFMKTRKAEYLNRAEIYFSEAVARNPQYDMPLGHLEKALIQRLGGDPKLDASIHRSIVETDRKGLEVNPFNPFIRKNLAEGLYNLGEREQAKNELQKAIDNEPNYVPGYLRMAEWSEELGQRDESQQYRKRAIQIVTQYKDQKFPEEFENLLLGRPPVARQ